MSVRALVLNFMRKTLFNLIKVLLDFLITFFIIAIIVIMGVLIAPIILFYIAKHKIRLKYDKSYIPYEGKGYD